MYLLGQLVFRYSSFASSSLIKSSQCRSYIFQSFQLTKHLPPTKFPTKFICRHTITSSNQQKTERIMTIPNILTFARIGSSPILGYSIISHHYPVAVTLFVLSGFTDLVDGWIARRYPSQASALGSFLDPLADKVLVGITVISLAYVNLIPIWLLMLIVSRDIAIMCVAGYLRVKSVQPPRTLKKILNMKHATVQLYPTFISKVNTGVQIGLLTLCMAAPIFEYHESDWMTLLYTLSAISTGVSWLSYTGKSGRATFKMLSQQSKTPPSSL